MLPRRRFICPDTGWEIPDSDDLRCTQVRWRQRPERPCHGRVASDANFPPAYGYLLAMPRAHALATKGYLTPCTCFRSHQRGLKKGLDKSCEQLFSKGNWSCSVCFGPVLSRRVGGDHEMDGDSRVAQRDLRFSWNSQCYRTMRCLPRNNGARDVS
jgi:hypothetical protein